MTWSSACSVSHSEAKPFSGGRPAIAAAPTRNAAPVQGIRRSRPPSRSSSSEPVACSNAPAPRKSSALKTAWLTTCRSAAPSANAAQSIGAASAQDEAGAEPEHDDPDVLDRVQREQPFEVVLEERVDDAADSRERADAPARAAPNQTGRTPTHSTSTRTRPYSATLIITPLISAETGAGAIGCARGSQTCSGITPAFVPMPTSAASAIAVWRPGAGADRGRVADRARVGQQQDRDPRPDPAEVRDGEVVEHRLPRRPVAAARDEDHRRREQRHQLPAGEERERVAGADDERERQQERRRQPGDRASRARVGSRYRSENTSAGAAISPSVPRKSPRQAVDAEARVEGARKA